MNKQDSISLKIDKFNLFDFQQHDHDLYNKDGELIGKAYTRFAKVDRNCSIGIVSSKRDGKAEEISHAALYWWAFNKKEKYFYSKSIDLKNKDHIFDVFVNQMPRTIKKNHRFSNKEYDRCNAKRCITKDEATLLVNKTESLSSKGVPLDKDGCPIVSRTIRFLPEPTAIDLFGVREAIFKKIEFEQKLKAINKVEKYIAT